VPPKNLRLLDGFNVFQKSMSEWLEESQDAALKKMWDTLAPRSP